MRSFCAIGGVLLVLLASAFADASEFTEYSGVRIKKEKAIIAMGENSDVKIVRTGASEVRAVADIVQLDGSIKIGSKKGQECNPSTAGTIQWLQSASQLQFCDGKSWRKFVLEGDCSCGDKPGDKEKPEEKPDKALLLKPKWVHTKSLVFNDDGSVFKTSGQGWNGAGAYTDATCKSGNCKFTAKILEQAKTSE